MRRLKFLAVAFSLLSLLDSGCASTASRLKLGRSPAVAEKSDNAKADSEKKEDAKKDPKATAVADKPAAPADKGNPFAQEKPATEVAQATPAADAKPAEAKPADPAPAVAQADAAAKPAEANPEKEAGKNPSWRPETLALIESELRGASAEERDYWYGQLKRVDPAVIPDILRARRLSMELAERMEAPSNGGVVTAGNSAAGTPSRSSTVDRLASPDAGLGSVSPWGQGATSVANGASTNSPSAPSDGVLPAGYPAPLGGATGVTPAAGASVTQGANTTGSPFLGGTAAANPGTLGPLAVRRIPYPHEVPANTGIELTAGTAGTPPTLNGATSPPSLVAPQTTSANGQSLASPVVSLSWQGDLERLISVVELDLSQNGASLSAHQQLQRQLYLRMLYLMAQRPERALTAIPNLSSADQEFCQQLLWAVANYLDAEQIPRPNDRASQAIVQLSSAVRRLREVADLEIRNVSFCQRIVDYGIYERFPREEFSPGQEVLVYAEIDNYKSEPTLDGQYRTVLRSTLEILSPAGEVRWQKEFPATEDLCRNTRRDYFHNYQFAIPDRLPLGPHLLKLTVFDELGGKMNSYSANFLVK